MAARNYYRSRATRARSALRCQQVWQLRYIHRDPARPIGCETSRLNDFREQNLQQRTVQCDPRKATVTSGTCHNCESNYAAFSPGAEGNSHAQDYLIRRCRRVGPDWCWNVVWRQNIYCHGRTGWLSRSRLILAAIGFSLLWGATPTFAVQSCEDRCMQDRCAAVMQSGQNWRGDDGSGSLDSSPV